MSTESKDSDSEYAIEIEFLPEHWSIIKSYAGIYHIRTDWDLTKLDNNVIQTVLGWVSPYSLSCNLNQYYHIINNLTYHKRIQHIWKYLDKTKLK
jgi:hypothetical protein